MPRPAPKGHVPALVFAGLACATVIGVAAFVTTVRQPVVYSPSPTPDLTAYTAPADTVIKKTIYVVTPKPIPPPPQKVIRIVKPSTGGGEVESGD